MIRIACAIYTRKSSDDGLDKEFNSLDAQREACEAFIRSQMSLAAEYSLNVAFEFSLAGRPCRAVEGMPSQRSAFARRH
jgi:DNA invertase Pin-like site-specific DNA recombinase